MRPLRGRASAGRVGFPQEAPWRLSPCKPHSPAGPRELRFGCQPSSEPEEQIMSRLALAFVSLVAFVLIPGVAASAPARS